jgi:hypothetical protein
VLTGALLRVQMAESERREEAHYTRLTGDILEGLQRPLRDLYDRMSEATQALTAITPEALRAHPSTLKMLRYAVAPAVSQMRLGQIAGLSSTAALEEGGASPTPEQAQRLARWFRERLDRERFPWVETATALTAPERAVAERYAKLWTVSLIANQNTATKYRNQRKQLQEEAVADALTRAGLTHQAQLNPSSRGARRRGGIAALDDVSPGHYVQEKKVLVGRNQKADLTARPWGAMRLLCVEAKAVGIRLDSTKRLKELADKQTDWRAFSPPITAAGACAGFFNYLELVGIVRGRGIPVFWEHDLDQLTAFVADGTYYGSPWEPAAQFPDVPAEQVSLGLERVETAQATPDAEETTG